MNKSNIHSEYREYLPLIQRKRIDFIYKFFLAIFFFIIADILSFYFPSWRYKDSIRHLPGFFTYFGLIVGVIILLQKKKTKIFIDFKNETLGYTYLTIFKQFNQREISLKGTYADLSQHNSGRNSKVWLLRIFKNGKCIFREKENIAHFSKDKLEIIYNDLKKLNE